MLFKNAIIGNAEEDVAVGEEVEEIAHEVERQPSVDCQHDRPLADVEAAQLAFVDVGLIPRRSLAVLRRRFGFGLVASQQSSDQHAGGDEQIDSPGRWRIVKDHVNSCCSRHGSLACANEALGGGRETEILHELQAALPDNFNCYVIHVRRIGLNAETPSRREERREEIVITQIAWKTRIFFPLFSLLHFLKAWPSFLAVILY